MSPEAAPVPLLERVSDARRTGATIFALEPGDPELDALAHETMAIAPGPGVPGAVSFGAAQHLISSAVGELGAAERIERGEFGVASADARCPAGPGYPRYRPGVRGLRDRVARLLDAVSGPSSLDRARRSGVQGQDHGGTLDDVIGRSGRTAVPMAKNSVVCEPQVWLCWRSWTPTMPSACSSSASACIRLMASSRAS